MASLAVVLLALFAQMERTYTLERAAHARAVAAAKGRQVGRPSVVDPDRLAYATHLRDTGHTIAEIVARTGVARTTLYRHLPARPAEPLTTTGSSNRFDRPLHSEQKRRSGPDEWGSSCRGWPSRLRGWSRPVGFPR